VGDLYFSMLFRPLPSGLFDPRRANSVARASFAQSNQRTTLGKDV
jgi:hypothetical protein